MIGHPARTIASTRRDQSDFPPPRPTQPKTIHPNATSGSSSATTQTEYQFRAVTGGHRQPHSRGRTTTHGVEHLDGLYRWRPARPYSPPARNAATSRAAPRTEPVASSPRPCRIGIRSEPSNRQQYRRSPERRTTRRRRARSSPSGDLDFVTAHETSCTPTPGGSSAVRICPVPTQPGLLGARPSAHAR